MSQYRYLQSRQITSDKGMSCTIYEIEGEDRIIRFLTTLPDTDEIFIYPKPPVKKLFAPERCETVEASHFLDLWSKGEKK